MRAHQSPPMSLLAKTSPFVFVRFRSLKSPKEDQFCLELSKLHTYDDVVKRVARYLGLDDPSKIRLTSFDCCSQTSDVLYYEVVSVPQPEPQGQGLKTSKIDFHHGVNDEELLVKQVEGLWGQAAAERQRLEEQVRWLKTELHHTRMKLKKELEEKELRRKENAETDLHAFVKVARDEDLLEQIGKDIYFDLVDHDKVCRFRIHKQMPFYCFKEEIAKEFRIPVHFQRYWLWAKRKNETYRPRRPLTCEEESQLVGELGGKELNLFLEIKFGKNLQPLPPPEKTEDDIILFFKLYDPLKEEFRYVGKLFVKLSGRPLEILTKLKEMAGFLADQEIELYEEIQFEPLVICEHIEKNLTFRENQLEDGDIICFQKSPLIGSGEKCAARYPDVPSFLEYVRSRLLYHRFNWDEEP